MLTPQETVIVCKQCESNVVCMFVVQHWSEDKDSVQGTDTAAPETSSWKQKVKRQLIDFIEFVLSSIVLSNNQYIISFKHLMI